MKVWKSIDRKTVLSGLAIALGAVVFYTALSNLEQIKIHFQQIKHYLAPVTGGLALAYVLRPFVHFMENRLLKRLKSEKARRHIASISTVALLIAVIIFLMRILLPQIYISITTFAGSIDTYIETAKSIIIKYSDKYEFLNINVEEWIGESNDLLHRVGEWITKNSSMFFSIFTELSSTLLNFVIVLAMSIYALLDRKNLKRGVVNLEMVILGEEKSNWLNRVISRGDSLMMKFLGSNLLDALIIGIVNFIFLSIFKAPYTVLLAVMLGVFNFIPTFGPIVGGVIGAFVVLITQPSLFIGFVIFTIVLQQIDGNVIKPVLFGDSTGMSPFWVLVSIVVGGRAFGVLGMILGIPMFALFRGIYSEVIEKLLEKRKKKEQVEKELKEAEDKNTASAQKNTKPKKT